MSIAFLLYLPERGPEVVRTYRDVIEAAPPEASGAALYLTGPPEEFVPPHLVGRLLAGALLTYAGPEDEMRKLAEPLLAIPHESEIVTAIPYADLQCMIDDPPGMRNYWSAEYLTGCPDAFVDVFCARAEAMPVPTGTQHLVFPQGGAVASGPADYPVPYRDSPWAVHPFGIWEDAADDERFAGSGSGTSAPTPGRGAPARSTSTSPGTRAWSGWSPASEPRTCSGWAR